MTPGDLARVYPVPHAWNIHYDVRMKTNQTNNNSDCSEGNCSETSDQISSQCCTTESIPELNLPRQRRTSKPWLESDLQQRLNRADEKESAREKEPLREIERVPRRWDRLARLVGEDGVRKLLGSRVTVLGLGGVGSYAVEALARSAVGHLTIVDFDDVCVTNVNRQLQAFPKTVGQPKADLLAQRVRAINPEIEVDSVQAFYDPQTSAALLTPRPDFVIDAIDNVTAKLHLISTCLQQDIPLVSCGAAGARMDPTQIRVADLSQTRRDPLIKVIRKELSRKGLDTQSHVGLPVVFSEEDIVEPQPPSWDADGFRCICPHAEDSPHACEKRRLIYGTASFVTSAFGMAAASVVVRECCK